MIESIGTWGTIRLRNERDIIDKQLKATGVRLDELVEINNGLSSRITELENSTSNPFLHLTLEDFVRENNAIENITDLPSREEIQAYEDFLELDTISVADLENFVRIVASVPIRDKPGMDVTVAGHRPPRGGPVIPQRLKALIFNLAQGDYYFDGTPAEIHEKYETLHPFIDGNGRSGRILWAWHKKKRGEDPFLFGFLRSFYYESLSVNSKR